MAYYRKCFVPTCDNDSENSPNKIIVRVREDLKQKWCYQVNTPYYSVDAKYCCEDHFDPQENLKNYFKHKLMGQEPKLKPNATLSYMSPTPEKLIEIKRKAKIKKQNDINKSICLTLLEKTTEELKAMANTSTCIPPPLSDTLEIASNDLTKIVKPTKLTDNLKISECTPSMGKMEEDTMNYMKYKMGFSQKLLLVDEAVPTKFHCQEDHKRESPKTPDKETITEPITTKTEDPEATFQYILPDPPKVPYIITPQTKHKTKNIKTASKKSITSCSTRKKPVRLKKNNKGNLNVQQDKRITRQELPYHSVVLINRIYNYLDDEYKYIKSMYPDSRVLNQLSNVIQRTAKATGVTNEMVINIIENVKKHGNLNNYMENADSDNVIVHNNLETERDNDIMENWKPPVKRKKIHFRKKKKNLHDVKDFNETLDCVERDSITEEECRIIEDNDEETDDAEEGKDELEEEIVMKCEVFENDIIQQPTAKNAEHCLLNDNQICDREDMVKEEVKDFKDSVTGEKYIAVGDYETDIKKEIEKDLVMNSEAFEAEIINDSLSAEQMLKDHLHILGT